MIKVVRSLPNQPPCPLTVLLHPTRSANISSRIQTNTPNSAFSQLSADRQFAHLGLMLLGILAQVDKALSAFASVPINDDDDAAANEAAEGPSANGTIMDQSTDDAPAQRHNDIGVAVSREELLAMMSASTSTHGPTEDMPARKDARDQPLPTTEIEFGEAATAGETMQGKDKKGKKRPREYDQYEDESSSLERTTPPIPEKKVKKKSKIEDYGDDIDDVLASFDKPSSKTKKASKSKTSTTIAKTATTKVETTTPVPAPKTSRQRSKDVDDLDDIFASLEEKPKKKKTATTMKASKKKTDDLDDIFASFDKPSKTKKTKKKKTGGADEFDDIFGGL